MLVQCKNCGAPLDGRDAKASIKCNYCGAVSITEQLPVQQAHVPLGWKPPQVWVAPPQFAAAGQQMAYRGIGGIQFIVVGIAIVASLVGGVFAAVRPNRAPSSDPATDATVDDWTGKATYRCKGSDRVHFTGITSSKLASVLDARGDCWIVVRGGTLDGTGNVIDVRDTAGVELHGVNIVFSGHQRGAAIRATGGAHVYLYDCTVSIARGVGEATAIDVSDASEVHIQGGRIEGRYVLRANGVSVIAATGDADVHGRVQKGSDARVEGVTEPGAGRPAATAPGPGAAGDCGCAPHDHACKHKCKKGH